MNNLKNDIPLVSVFSKQSIVVEQLRSIRASVSYISEIQQVKTILFSSAEVDEGKSTMVANLAVLYAERGSNVLLVDADLRNPTIQRAFHLPNEIGLSNWLGEKIRSIEDIIQSTGVKDLSVVTSGNLDVSSTSLLDSSKMNEFLDYVKAQYDFVLIDTTPMTAVSDAQVLSTKVDGTLLVVRENVTRKKALGKAIQLLQLSGSNLLGTIYNGARKSVYSGYY